MVYSADGLAGRKAKAAEKRIAALFAATWRRPYSMMVHYVWVWMALAIVKSNSLLIRGSRDRQQRQAEQRNQPLPRVTAERGNASCHGFCRRSRACVF